MPLDLHNDILKEIAKASGTLYAETAYKLPIVFWCANKESFNNSFVTGNNYSKDCFPCVTLYPFITSDSTVENFVFTVQEHFGDKNIVEQINWSKFSEIVDKMRNGVETCKLLINKKKLETIDGDFKDENN